ncbi:MAG: GNAT family N-acetyltransferase [Intrasporangium sp.]|uniref:GNAT family N-acetyltransferase n=1 Tax=Intrasporangium sp. TaxID=1925024 RepID=UPI003F7F270D
MTDLIAPSTQLATEWWGLVDEFGDEPVHGSGLHDRSEPAREPAQFAAWVRTRLGAGRADTALGPGMVHADYWWIRHEGRLAGTITLRHALTPALLLVGGHIGYAVRPSLRRQGIASAALRLVLAEAAARGLDPVLITCDDDNLASARTIEGAGGVLEDVRDGSRRYWVSTAAAAKPLGTEPVETARATLATFTRSEVGGILTGRRRPDWDEAFPREDDLDAVRAATDEDPYATRGIRDRASGLVVGTIGSYGPPDREGRVEVGYGLVESARGTGLMTDVLGGYVRALLASGVREVVAHTEVGNVSSERVLGRLGFERLRREPGPDGGDQWLWRLDGGRHETGLRGGEQS